MKQRLATWIGFLVLMAWLPFPGCNLSPSGGSTDNTNDNTADNTNDNADDNSNDSDDDNANDNSVDNDNTTDNGNDNDDQSTAHLAVFDDPNSDFSTTDVRDVDDEIVQFDTVTKAIIWAADGTAYQAGSWTVDGVFLAGGGFQVRFGTKDGERRAYFTETGPATICQIRPAGGFLSISATNVTVPQE